MYGRLPRLGRTCYALPLGHYMKEFPRKTLLEEAIVRPLKLSVGTEKASES